MPEPPAPGFSVKPTLTGEAVVLRPISFDQDAAALRAMLQDPQGLKLTGSSHAPDAAANWDDAAEETFRDWYSSRNAQPDRLDLAVVDKPTQLCAGEVVLNQWDPANASCAFRILLGADGRDRGLGTEATRLIVGYGFERLGLHRIWLEVYSFNPRARHVYNKIGFVLDGILRHALRWDDQWIDAATMSILADEWQRHRGYPDGR